MSTFKAEQSGFGKLSNEFGERVRRSLAAVAHKMENPPSFANEPLTKRIGTAAYMAAVAGFVAGHAIAKMNGFDAGTLANHQHMLAGTGVGATLGAAVYAAREGLRQAMSGLAAPEGDIELLQEAIKADPQAYNVVKGDKQQATQKTNNEEHYSYGIPSSYGGYRAGGQQANPSPAIETTGAAPATNKLQNSGMKL